MLAVGLPGCPQATRNVAGAGTRNQLPGRREVRVGVPRQVAGPALQAFCFSLSNSFSSGVSGVQRNGSQVSLLQAGLQRILILWNPQPSKWGPRADKAKGHRPDTLDCSGARVMFPDTTRMGQREEGRQRLRQGEMRKNRGRDMQQGG